MHIAQYLDEPFKLVLWPIDECLSFLVPFLGLMLGLDSPITGMVMGVFLTLGLQRLKGEEGGYAAVILCYWYLPNVLALQFLPPSWQRWFIG